MLHRNLSTNAELLIELKKITQENEENESKCEKADHQSFNDLMSQRVGKTMTDCFTEAVGL